MKISYNWQDKVAILRGFEQGLSVDEVSNLVRIKKDAVQKLYDQTYPPAPVVEDDTEAEDE